MATIEEVLTRLASFEPRGVPVLSVYLDARADRHGKDRFEPFLKNRLAELEKTFPARSPQRESFDADRARVYDYIGDQLRAETNTLALFACSGADLFEELQLDVGGIKSQVYASSRPQIYPLLLIENRAPRCAVVNVDRRHARIFEVGLQGLEATQTVDGAKTNRTQVGGWAQARYQRHVDEMSKQHLKDVVAALREVVEADGIQKIVLAGDSVIIPELRAMLPTNLAEMVIDELRLDIKTPEHELVNQARKALDEHDTRLDADTVHSLLEAYRSGGLATVGHKHTHEALKRGQVDELVLASNVRGERPGEAETFVRLATETGAGITFVENSELLSEVEGVGAVLRYRL